MPAIARCCLRCCHTQPTFHAQTQRHWALNSSQLRRYLRARDSDLDAAFELLAGSLRWRDDEQVWSVRDEFEDELRFEGRTGKMYRFGFDKKGRPLIYSRDRRQNSESHEGKVRYVIDTLERAAESMRDGAEQWVFVFDFAGYSLSNAPPMKTSKAVLDIFLNQYPERLGSAFMVIIVLCFLRFENNSTVYLPDRRSVLFQYVLQNDQSFCSK